MYRCRRIKYRGTWVEYSNESSNSYVAASKKLESYLVHANYFLKRC